MTTAEVSKGINELLLGYYELDLKQALYVEDYELALFRLAQIRRLQEKKGQK